MGRIIIFLFAYSFLLSLAVYKFPAFAQLPAIRETIYTFVGDIPGGISCPTLQQNPDGCLQTNFNVRVTGATHEQKIEIFERFSIPGRSPQYRTLMQQAGPTTVEIRAGSCGGGKAPGGRRIIMYGFFNCRSLTRTYLVIHESGHILAQGHGRLYNLFKDSGYYPKDQSCYKHYPGAYLRTYKPISGSGTGQSESFAESVSSYVLYKQWSNNGVNLHNYPTECRAGYSWIRDNIYGSGVTF